MKYMYRKFLQGILPLATMLSPENLLAQEIVYQEFYQHIQEMETQGDYEGALKALKAGSGAYPDHSFTLLKEEIYLQEKLDRHEDNLALFRQGHNQGYFFFLHPSLSASEPYSKLEGFETLSATDLKLRSEALKSSETLYTVVLPENHSRKETHPVLYIFHGGGSHLSRAMDHWHSPTLDSEFIRVYVQSYLYYDSNTYGWRSGDERAFREISEIHRLVLADQPADSEEVYAAGISAGGTFAIDLSVRQVIPLKGFIAFCPGIPKILSGDAFGELPDIGGYIIGGEDDYYLPRQQKMAELFDRMQFRYQHIVVPGMAHQYPVDESIRLEQALKYLRK